MGVINATRDRGTNLGGWAIPVSTLMERLHSNSISTPSFSEDWDLKVPNTEESLPVRHLLSRRKPLISAMLLLVLAPALLYALLTFFTLGLDEIGFTSSCWNILHDPGKKFFHLVTLPLAMTVLIVTTPSRFINQASRLAITTGVVLVPIFLFSTALSSISSLYEGGGNVNSPARLANPRGDSDGRSDLVSMHFKLRSLWMRDGTLDTQLRADYDTSYREHLCNGFWQDTSWRGKIGLYLNVLGYVGGIVCLLVWCFSAMTINRNSPTIPMTSGS